MPDLPVILRLARRRCLIVGGGAVARRRAHSLLAAGAHLTVVAPAIDPALRALPVVCHERPYNRADLADKFLVVIATDQPRLNEIVAEDAFRAGVLINRTDAPEQGDLIFPAHEHHGPVTLCVHTSGISAAAAATIRRELAACLDPDWPRLLELVAPFRKIIQQAIADPTRRQEQLRKLTDPAAMQCLKTHGPDALLREMHRLTTPPTAPAGESHDHA